MKQVLYKLPAPNGFISDPSLVLYLPLYQLDGTAITSKDAYGHLCSVTGVTWRPDGRCFDGVDDEIDCGNGSSIQIGGAITIGLFHHSSRLPVLQSSIGTYCFNTHEEGEGE